VQVQPDGVGGAVVAERVRDVGRHGDEAARRHTRLLRFRADQERQLSLEHVEGVRVLAVDVQVRPALAGRVAGPGDRQLGPLGQDHELSPLLVGDDLAAGPHGGGVSPEQLLPRW
jgi:hypothetical protein